MLYGPWCRIAGLFAARPTGRNAFAGPPFSSRPSCGTWLVYVSPLRHGRPAQSVGALRETDHILQGIYYLGGPAEGRRRSPLRGDYVSFAPIPASPSPTSSAAVCALTTVARAGTGLGPGALAPVSPSPAMCGP